MDNLRKAIERNGATKIAADLGVTVTSIYNWLNGRSKPSRLARKRLDTLGIKI